MSLYSKHADIDLVRQKSDLMYHLIVNTDASTLDEFCKKIAENLLVKYKNPSVRLQQMLERVTNDNDRIAKHALLFFSLNEAKELQEIFLSDDVQYVPPQKFTDFVTRELPQLCEKLLNGSYTSLRSFTEDCRWIYMTL